MEKPFKNQEVLKSLNDEKAPGPIGFTMRFFKEFWDVIGLDTMKAMEVFNHNSIVLKLECIIYQAYSNSQRRKMQWSSMILGQLVYW